jgi:hypothetical protein
VIWLQPVPLCCIERHEGFSLDPVESMHKESAVRRHGERKGRRRVTSGKLGARRFFSRRGILAAGFVVACMMTALAAEKADISNLSAHDITVSARSIGFSSGQPDKRDFGRLDFLGGLTISSKSEYFGGYSGISVDAKGAQFLAISDSGSWLSGTLDYKGGLLSGVSAARVGPIPQKDGTPFTKNRDRDAEAIVALKHGGLDGRYLIAFERRHRIEEYAFEKGEMRGPLARRQLPQPLKSMKSNDGLESTTIVRGGVNAGAMISFAEKKLTADGNHTGAMVKDGKAHPLFIKRNEEFDISDLQSLKDGSLMVLERSFIPSRLKLGIRLRLIKAADVKPGAMLDGDILLDAGSALEIDNFEGLAVHENQDGESVLTLISDDNFSFIQRTLLMQFKLKEAKPRA